MGGSDAPYNLCKLTPEEHYIAHLLLFKIAHADDAPATILYKLSAAVNRMRSGNQQGRYDHMTRNKSFGVARRMFSEFHPCKQPEIQEKIRNGVNSTRLSRNEASISAYGCVADKRVCYINICRVCLALETSETEIHHKFCSPSCRSFGSITEEYREKLSTVAKTRLSKLTPEEQEVRMLKSCRAPKTPEQRAAINAKISETKAIRIAKIKQMSDDEFRKYAMTISLYTRTNKRNNNLCGLLHLRGLSVDDYYNSRIQESK
jgi:hypothetical protein